MKIYIYQKIDELISGEFSNEDLDDINAELEDILSASVPKLPEVPQDKLPDIIKSETSTYNFNFALKPFKQS